MKEKKQLNKGQEPLALLPEKIYRQLKSKIITEIKRDIEKEREKELEKIYKNPGFSL